MSTHEPRSYISSDYAGIKGGSVELYYGYEIEHEGEWCFQLKKDGRPIRTIPFSQLPGKPDQEECEECLMAGIAMLLKEAHLS